jgi:hypothetical protein
LICFLACGKGRAWLLAGSPARAFRVHRRGFILEFPADQTPLLTCPVLLTLKLFLFENYATRFAICLEGDMGAGQIVLE